MPFENHFCYDNSKYEQIGNATGGDYFDKDEILTNRH